MACKPITFNGVSESVLKGIQKDLQTWGLSIPFAHTGMIEGSGVLAEFKWDEDNSVLWVHLVKKPFIVSCSFIYDKLGEAVARNGGASG